MKCLSCSIAGMKRLRLSYEARLGLKLQTGEFIELSTRLTAVRSTASVEISTGIGYEMIQVYITSILKLNK